MEKIMPALTDGAIAICVSLISLLCAFAVSGLRALTTKLRTESRKMESEQLRLIADEAIDRVNDLATKAVMYTEQTIAKDLREQVKSGQADKSLLKTLGANVCLQIQQNLQHDLWYALEDTVGDVERYIRDTVEAKVYELKQQNALMVPAEIPAEITETE